MKYINTKQCPVRLFTSKGVITLDGLQTIELDEVVGCPDFVVIEGKKEVVETTVEPTTVSAASTKSEKKVRRSKKTEE